MRFTIQGKLPSLNEYINACRRNRYAGAKFKRDTEIRISAAIRKATIAGELWPTDNAIILHFTWHERTKRRDADNIASAKKFILDAMQKCGIIPDDGRRYVRGFTDEIVDDSIDFIEVCTEKAD